MTRRQEAPVLPAKYLISNRTVEPHPAVHWMANPDPDPALKNVLKITYKEFSAVEKDKKDCSKVLKKTMKLVQMYCN